MKKILSLFMVILMLFSITYMVPTVYAEEASYTIIDKDLAKVYWEEIYDTKTIVKSGDWYYTCSSEPSLEGAKIGVCGYKGSETHITVPKEFFGKKVTYIREFYIMSNTVKTIKIPKEIVSINGENEYEYSFMEEDSLDRFKVCAPVIECGNSLLEEIIVDSENPNYKSEDGVLFTKNGKRLIYYPHYKAGEKYVVPDTVKYISHGAFNGSKYLKSLTITPNVVELGYDSIPKNTLEELRFENTHLPQYMFIYDDSNVDEDFDDPPRYIPDVPNTVVYCFGGTDLYNHYKNSFEEPEAMCKELKALPPFEETLKKETDGKWYYYENEYKVLKSTLVKYKDVWFYVTNGVWDKTVSDKIIKYKDKWFYIKNGKWNSNINTLVKIGGEWLGIENGKWDSSAKTLIKYKGKWFYIKSGKWDSSAKTLTKYKGKWFYIKNGKWCKDTAIVKYKGKRFYVKNGKVDFDYSGKKKIDGKTYKIKNGKVA